MRSDRGKSKLPRRRAVLISLLLAALAPTGCATRTEFFLNRAHRMNYALETEELQSLQFYISTDVLAHEIGTKTEGTPTSVYVVKRDTPGVVTEAGPTWLRVSFGPTRGAPFVTVPDEEDDSWYWLATEVEQGLRRVRDVDDKVVVVDGRRFRLAYGINARLLVNSKDLRKLIEKRAHAPGRVKD
jgi:hypothetical protein